MKISITSNTKDNLFALKRDVESGAYGCKTEVSEYDVAHREDINEKYREIFRSYLALKKRYPDKPLMYICAIIAKQQKRTKNIIEYMAKKVSTTF
jgi:hypothetical protein